jgi:hypothetical protein
MWLQLYVDQRETCSEACTEMKQGPGGLYCNTEWFI